MKKILVPTDFSDCAEAAAEVAMALAKKAGAEIYFIHICPDTSMKAHVPGVKLPFIDTNKEVSGGRSELSVLVNKAESLGVKATPILVFDRGNEKIENYIEPYLIDFIVMGSHGVKGIRELVLGSNTQRMVRHVKVPVLVVKEKPASLNFKNILFASSFQEDVASAFKEVISLASLMNSNVHIVYINFIDHLVEPRVAEARMKSLEDNFPAIKFSTNLAETNDEEYAIHEFANELQADIISLTAHDKNGLVKFLSPSVAEALVNHENKPVLVLGGH